MSEDHQELVAIAEDVLRVYDGEEALRRLEWSPQLDTTDRDWQRMFAALFEAQGRTLAVTPALGDLLAGAYGYPGFTVALAAQIHDSSVMALRLRGDNKPLLADVAGAGLLKLTNVRSNVKVHEPLGHDLLEWVSGEAHKTVLCDKAAAPGRETAMALARIAVSLEILGASQRLMELATDYARMREQFGHPIGGFQAVQHILADGHVQICALRDASALTVQSLKFDDGINFGATLLKALAGRTGRRVGQATLQVLGAIGFTWEHDHHRFYRRILTLDALLGSVDDLRPQLADARVGNRLWRVRAL